MLFSKLKTFHFHKKPAVPKLDTITKLPYELLVVVYQHLDSQDSCLEFARSCRKFYMVSREPRSKAAWIVTRFGTRFAIYYALLSLPERCTMSFLEMLFHMGAVVPSHLLQSLIQVYGKHDTALARRNSRRRRSSFDDLVQLQQEFFSNQVQKLSFEGYVTLLQQQKTVHVQDDDVGLFLETARVDMIHTASFFPAPLLHQDTKKACYRQLIKLSTEDFECIAPVFEFDPVARASLWDSVLLVLFDEAFRHSQLTPERRTTLYTIQHMMAGRVALVGPMNDQTLFCKVFAQFFAKYPEGYCNQKTMDKLFTLCTEYVKPSTFSIRHALEYMVLAQIGRGDTIESIDLFFSKK